MKKILLFVVLIIGAQSNAYSQEMGTEPSAAKNADTLRESSQESSGLSKAQWWVLGVTGVVLVGSSAASHNHEAAKGRAAVAVVGLAAFVGVTLYQNSKKKEKVALTMVNGSPSLAFTKSF